MNNDQLFPVVAIGASAGGLEAISSFLEHVSPDLGMAYIIIQHLSPSHESILPELLERKTRMKVYQVTDGMTIQPDCVFVIPPNTYMSVVDHKLTLSARTRQSGGAHSIDHFLMALAPIYQNNAVAVILSGTASDGTEGVRAIKAEGGITFAQDGSAKFSGMPQNAINSGHIDFVFPPERIAYELALLHAFPYTGADSLDSISVQEHELRKIHQLLFNNLNVDFSNYKQTTITRRILRRMALNKVKDVKDYAKILRDNPGELHLLYKDLLINVTGFFREPQLYEAFPKRVLPTLLKEPKPGEVIRIWVPACSTGEEVYSIAICLFEYMSDNGIVSSIQLFATDLSEGAIEKARTGTYSKMSLEKVSKTRLEKYFIPINGQFQIIKPIRDICVFATHDLLKDPPFSRLNLISCQNVMIYLQPEAQKKILQAFHYALRPGGLLLLGKSETIGKSSELFSPIDKDFKLFAKKSISNTHFDFSVRSNYGFLAGAIEDGKAGPPVASTVDSDKEAEKILLSRFVPASVTVDKDLHILQFYGPTQGYFRPATGKASLYLMKMVREELAFDVKTLINKAKKDGIALRKNKILLAKDTEQRMVNIEIIPLRPKSKDPVFLILFREEHDGLSPVRSPDCDGGGKESKVSENEQITVLEEEIKSGREQLKSITEESDANREELQSANEEILSSNEELQSINEELETSKEELQSTNEELTTINEELYHRNADLKESVEYSNAIIQTMTEPLIVLNSDMRVRTANNAFYKMFKGTADETEGFYFFQIGKGVWNFQELHQKLEEIFNGQKKYETFELTNDFALLGSKTLLFNVMQLNHENNKNQRYLLAIQDITDRVNYLRELNSNKEYFRLLVQNAFDIITIYAIDGTVKYQSESLIRVLGYEPEERIGRSERNDGLVHPDDVDRYNDMFQRCLATRNSIINQEFRLKHKDGSYRQIEAVCMNLLDNQYINGLVGNYRDITNQKALERQKEEFIAVASHELKTPVTSIKGYSQIIKEHYLSDSQPELKELMQRMNHQVGRLSTLVENLLDVTKIAGGQLQLQIKSFDINVLLTELVEEARKITRMELVTELQPCDDIQGDRERIGQVVTNLLSNAIKYSPTGGKVILRSAYTAPLANEKARVTVSVQDFGIGVSQEQQTFIFERFIRVKNNNTNSIPGLGLGLYISSQIIRRHEGSIWVRSTGTGGSVFGFTLPVEANISGTVKVY